jgi:tetratricopeptide (TPR) repeat protein
MAIKGSLREASLPDVLQLLAMGQKSGCLSVSHKSNFGYIYFNRGRICYASIVNRRDRLGDILVKSGAISQAQLDQAIAEQTPQRDKRVGEILVAMGAIEREELHRQIKTQIEEAVYFLFTWSQGSFSFEADVRPDEQDFLVNINPESLLLEGARRVDEWSLIEKKIPSFDLVFELDRQHLSQAEVALTPEQDTLLPLIDGRRDITQLVDESGLVEFEVGKAIFGLITAGFLHRIGKSKAAEPQVPDARVEEHRNLGVAFYKTGMLDEAMREFRRVIELREHDSAARFYVGLVLMKQHRWPEALVAFREATAMPGAKAAAYHNLAYALERLGRWDEAQQALAEAARRGGSGDPRTLMSIGVIALRRGDLAGAEAQLMAARPLFGKRPVPPAWFHYAALLAALAADLERAASLLKEGIALHPHAAPLHNNLAVVLERRGQYEDAVAAAEQGAQEDSALAQLHKNLGDLSYRRGQYDAAQESYLRAVKANAGLGADVYLKLGNIRYRQHDQPAAVAYWERAAALDPGNAIVRSNLEATRRTLQGAG